MVLFKVSDTAGKTSVSNLFNNYGIILIHGKSVFRIAGDKRG